jgi:hypothetical protein
MLYWHLNTNYLENLGPLIFNQTNFYFLQNRNLELEENNFKGESISVFVIENALTNIKYLIDEISNKNYITLFEYNNYIKANLLYSILISIAILFVILFIQPFILNKFYRINFAKFFINFNYFIFFHEFLSKKTSLLKNFIDNSLKSNLKDIHYTSISLNLEENEAMLVDCLDSIQPFDIKIITYQYNHEVLKESLYENTQFGVHSLNKIEEVDVETSNYYNKNFVDVKDAKDSKDKITQNIKTGKSLFAKNLKQISPKNYPNTPNSRDNPVISPINSRNAFIPQQTVLIKKSSNTTNSNMKYGLFFNKKNFSSHFGRVSNPKINTPTNTNNTNNITVTNSTKNNHTTNSNFNTTDQNFLKNNEMNDPRLNFLKPINYFKKWLFIILVSFIFISVIIFINYITFNSFFEKETNSGVITKITLERVSLLTELLLIYQISLLKGSPLKLKYQSNGYLNNSAYNSYLNTVNVDERDVFQDTLSSYDFFKTGMRYLIEGNYKSNLVDVENLEREMNSDNFCQNFTNSFNNVVDNSFNLKFMQNDTQESLYNDCIRIGKGVNNVALTTTFDNMINTITILYNEFIKNTTDTYVRFNDPNLQILQAEINFLFEKFYVKDANLILNNYFSDNQVDYLDLILLILIILSVLILFGFYIFKLNFKFIEEEKLIEVIQDLNFKTLLF